MPRRSANDIATLRPASAVARHKLVPGEHVPEAAREIFAEILTTVAADHFLPVDRPLLEQYAVAVWVARELAATIERDGVVIDGRVSPATRNLKTQQALCGQLASRLRLTTQNRISKDKATTTANGGASSIAELYDRSAG